MGSNGALSQNNLFGAWVIPLDLQTQDTVGVKRDTDKGLISHIFLMPE